MYCITNIYKYNQFNFCAIKIKDMISKIQNWFYIIAKTHFRNKPISKTNQHLLQRDLENCLTLDDITTLKEVVKLCHQDFTQEDLLTFVLNINYRKRIIEYCNEFLTKKRYSTLEIRNMLFNTGSYAVCDAIKLHFQKNKDFYLMDYNGHEKRVSVDLYQIMIRKQKEIIFEKYKKLESI